MKKFQFAHRDDIMFTSDTHFGHANIIRFCKRPYSDASEMNEALIRNWNSVVAHTQTVFHLGDFAFKNQTQSAVIRQRLNGNIILIRGNHDPAYTVNLFDEVHDIVEVSVANCNFVLCHYAMRVWHHSNRGAWHLHGHSHGQLPLIPGNLAVDVGVDAWDYTPVRFDQIAKAMQRLSL